MVSKQLATDLAGESRVINMAAVATERIIGASATASYWGFFKRLFGNHSPVSVKSVQLYYVSNLVYVRQEDATNAQPLFVRAIHKLSYFLTFRIKDDSLSEWVLFENRFI